MDKTEWILCPLCGNKTRNKVREDTVLKNYPLYCPKCRQETLIEAKNLQVTVITEPDTLDADARVIIVKWYMKLYTKTGHGGGRNWTGYMIR